MDHYTDSFYKGRHKKTVYSANKILSILLEILPKINSAIDIGCGIGTWLKALQSKGIIDIQGVDGTWVNKDLLEIPERDFLQADLKKTINISKRYDLAVSLEVAEHLPEKNAHGFILSLTKLADFILFSAAIPYQPGKNHINTRWPDYWNRIFSENGYKGVDIIRKKIWNDREIPVWYRQNTILYVLKKRLPEINLKSNLSDLEPVSIVHPETYLSKASSVDSLRDSWRIFRQALKRYLKE